MIIYYQHQKHHILKCNCAPHLCLISHRRSAVSGLLQKQISEDEDVPSCLLQLCLHPPFASLECSLSPGGGGGGGRELRSRSGGEGSASSNTSSSLSSSNGLAISSGACNTGRQSGYDYHVHPTTTPLPPTSARPRHLLLGLLRLLDVGGGQGQHEVVRNGRQRAQPVGDLLLPHLDQRTRKLEEKMIIILLPGTHVVDAGAGRLGRGGGGEVGQVAGHGGHVAQRGVRPARS